MKYTYLLLGKSYINILTNYNTLQPLHFSTLLYRIRLGYKMTLNRYRYLTANIYFVFRLYVSSIPVIVEISIKWQCWSDVAFGRGPLLDNFKIYLPTIYTCSEYIRYIHVQKNNSKLSEDIEVTISFIT